MQHLRPIGRPTTGVSTNDLDTVTTMLSQKMQLHRSKGRDIGKDEVYEMIMYQSAETLAAVMKADEAMLLSRLYQEFLSMIQIESKHYPSLSLTEEKHSQSSLGFV